MENNSCRLELGDLISPLSTKCTGLPVVIWVCINDPVNPNETPCVKFRNDYSKSLSFDNHLSLSISGVPRILESNKINISTEDFNKIKRWVKVNSHSLLKHWRMQISTSQLLEDLNQTVSLQELLDLL